MQNNWQTRCRNEFMYLSQKDDPDFNGICEQIYFIIFYKKKFRNLLFNDYFRVNLDDAVRKLMMVVNKPTETYHVSSEKVCIFHFLLCWASMKQ